MPSTYIHQCCFKEAVNKKQPMTCVGYMSHDAVQVTCTNRRAACTPKTLLLKFKVQYKLLFTLGFQYVYSRVYS